MILDTNAISGLLAGDEALGRILGDADRHHVPIVVVGEYRYGLRASARGQELSVVLDSLLRESHILYLDLETASRYATVRQGLKQRGTPLPENDVWIASLALQHRLPVVSRDHHFDLVPSVRRVPW